MKITEITSVGDAGLRVLRESGGDVLLSRKPFVLSIDNEYYAPVEQSEDGLYVRKLDRFYPSVMKSLDDTEIPRCPLCGSIIDDSEPPYAHVCAACGASVRVEKEYVVRYNANVITEPAVITLE